MQQQAWISTEYLRKKFPYPVKQAYLPCQAGNGKITLVFIRHSLHVRQPGTSFRFRWQRIQICPPLNTVQDLETLLPHGRQIRLLYWIKGGLFRKELIKNCLHSRASIPILLRLGKRPSNGNEPPRLITQTQRI